MEILRPALGEYPGTRPELYDTLYNGTVIRTGGYRECDSDITHACIWIHTAKVDGIQVYGVLMTGDYSGPTFRTMAYFGTDRESAENYFHETNRRKYGYLGAFEHASNIKM